MPGLDVNALLTGGASAVTVMAFIIVAMLRGYLVPGWVYTELKGRTKVLEEQIPANTAATRAALDALAAAGVRAGEVAERVDARRR